MKRWMDESHHSLITSTLERSPIKETVLETDTGGYVRNARRLKENECKGTRPIDSVTSGEGELVWEQISRRE